MNKRHLFSIMAVFAVASVSILAIGGWAEDDLSAAPEIVKEEGTCGADGDNLKWAFTTSDRLYITGTGRMADYEPSASINPPWKDLDVRIVKIESGATSIGNHAFNGCTKLESVTIPESVTSIGSVAFINCTSLKTVEIPGSVTSIGVSAFQDCTGLTSVTIPRNMTSIGNGAFYGCKNLVSITVPSGIGVIGSSILADCGKLTTLTIYRTDGSNDASRIISADWNVWGAANVKSLVVDGDLVLPDLEGAEGREVKFTSSSVSTEGGTFYGRDGSSELTGKDRAGRTFSYDVGSEKWIQTFRGPINGPI